MTRIVAVIFKCDKEIFTGKVHKREKMVLKATRSRKHKIICPAQEPERVALCILHGDNDIIFCWQLIGVYRPRDQLVSAISNVRCIYSKEIVGKFQFCSAIVKKYKLLLCIDCLIELLYDKSWRMTPISRSYPWKIAWFIR